MARKFLTAVDLGKNELQNASIQNLGSAPGTPVKGQLYFNTGDNTLYWWDGSGWASARGGGTGFPGFGAITQEQAFGATKNDGVATTTARADHTHGNPVHDNAAHSAITLNSLAAPTGVVNFGTQNISGLAEPTAPTHAATKNYVDNLTAGLAWKDSVRAATTANGALASAFQNAAVIDGVTLATGNRILLKNQTTTTENGIYTVNASGAPTRATDADAVGELEGAAVFIQEGTTQLDTAWVCTTNAPITPGTTGTAWAQFGAGTAYTGGTGMVLSGSTFNVQTANGSIVVGADDIQVGFAGTGAAVTAARSDHNHDTTYPKRYSGGVLAATSTPIGHGLNTRNVIVSVFRSTAPYDEIDCDIEHTDANTVTLRFSVAPTLSEYTYVVIG